MTLFILSVVFGISGGVLRAQELRYAFGDINSVGRMPDAWHGLTIAMIALSAVFALLAFLYSRRNYEPKQCPVPSILQILAGLILAVTASGELHRTFIAVPRVTSQLLYAVLFALAALAVLTTAIRSLLNKSNTNSLALLIPIFWGCFRLMNTFFLHAANPVRTSYAYGLFSDVAMAFTLLLFAGIYFGQHKTAPLRLGGALACFFGITSLLAPLLYRLQGYAFDTLPHTGFSREFSHEALLIDLGVYAFTALLGAVALLTSGCEPKVDSLLLSSADTAKADSLLLTNTNAEFIPTEEE